MGTIAFLASNHYLLFSLPASYIIIKRPARDACLCMGDLEAPLALPAPAAPHFVFLITLVTVRRILFKFGRFRQQPWGFFLNMLQ